MHMADALVSPQVAGTMIGLSAIAAAVSIKKISKEDNTKKVALMGVMGAFVFATQMVNFTIPGTGSSGHLCGGFLLSAILGPYAGFLTMIGVLLIQALFFADGGLLAFGCNVWNMAFYGCFFGALCVWKPMMKKSCNIGKIIAASVIGCVVSLEFGALSVTLETLISGITELPFGTFVAAMLPIHLAIGLVEGLISAAVLCFLYKSRPDFLWEVGEKSEGKLSVKNTFIVLVVVCVVIAAGVSLLASSNPDGLEWSIQKLTGSTELESSGKIYEDLSNVQQSTSFLPDYALKDNDSVAGTSLSGVVGSAIVFAILAGIGMIKVLIQKNKKKKVNE